MECFLLNANKRQSVYLAVSGRFIIHRHGHISEITHVCFFFFPPLVGIVIWRQPIWDHFLLGLSKVQTQPQGHQHPLQKTKHSQSDLRFKWEQFQKCWHLRPPWCPIYIQIDKIWVYGPPNQCDLLFKLASGKCSGWSGWSWLMKISLSKVS